MRFRSLLAGIMIAGLLGAASVAVAQQATAVAGAATLPVDVAGPGPVTDLSVIGGVGRLSASWAAPTDSGGSTLVGYRATAGGQACTTEGLTECTFTGLPQGSADVTVQVQALNAAGAGEPATAVAIGTRLDLAVSPPVQVFAATVTISGVAQDSGGGGRVGVQVALERRLSGSTSWSVIKDVTTSSTGTFSYSMAATRNQVVRARFAGAENSMGAITSSRTSLVRAKVIALAYDTTLLLAQDLRLRGSVWPARPYAQVSLQQYVSGQWRSVQSTKTRPDSTYAFRRTLMSDVDRQWRVVAPATNTLSVGISSATRVYVKRALNATIKLVSRYDVRYSWRPGCPVHYSQLRAITLNHWDMNGGFSRGTIIVRSSAVAAVKAGFDAGLSGNLKIRSVIPIERYYAGGTRTGTQADIASMNADNTSAFNCRRVVGHPERRSAHSFGEAMDINPRENPYVTGGKVYPIGSSTYLKRKNHRAGMLFSSTPMVKVLRSYGWVWLAPIGDYQHISRGGY